MTHPPPTEFERALAARDASSRLRAAMLAGTYPAPEQVDPLIARCALESDFFVRDMLTWALTRHPEHLTVPRLVARLTDAGAQARSQALHTLSKIGASRAWPAVRRLLDDPVDEVARSAWRAAAVLAPALERPETLALLAGRLGRGTLETQQSLSRALITLAGSDEHTLSEALRAAPDTPQAREHAAATEQLRADPDSGFALAHAKKVRALASSPDADR
ncbi:HEAT repeat domain-containing protein [Ruania suaedae]|uniref:HEAT repeat domain-containing protein n=1 Tax=Ruania suaedae TaxID=2897774 RepID=UPI001E62B62A|nr:HEAT repeat domain-containing protein [Ruania suaedae]UFU02622.1 HEAT repeat domain-containing protein [Ruania suaedae]